MFDRVLRMADLDFLAVEHDRSALDRLGAEDRPHQFGSPRAHQPGQPDDLAGVQVELVDQAGRSPAPDTLAWYRLACTLPDRLPAQANLARGDADRSRALRDYALIKQELGGCARTRK